MYTEINPHSATVSISRDDQRLSWVARFLLPFSWLGVDIYVPAMTEVGKAFGTPVPLSISFYTLGLGVGQLLFGPLSDRFGRKAIAFVGMLLFSLFSFLPLLTKNVDLFLVLRALQGFAASASFVCADALIRDRFSGAAALREYGFLQAAGNVIPVIAIPFGTLLLTLYGWRGSFIFLSGLGLFMAGYVLVYMTETHTYRGKIQTQGAVTPWRNLPFLGFVACCTAGFSIIMTYVILAPDELMSRLNISPWNYGIITSANALFMGIFAILFSKIGQRIGAFSTLLLTLIVLATGGIGFIIGYNWHDIPSFIIFSAVISIGFGGLLGPASSLAMQPFSENKGQAAAILGASQLLGAAFVTTLLSHFQMISRLSLGTLTLILTGVCGLICFFLVRRFGKERLQNPLQSDISPHETVFAV